ncbi:hypothetical protein ACSNOI_03905 [Actinomadura kijaniata]|uniref:hypothetical protein n=1 Tax=Actinomadura kijaniata TaxID=46161 RepID=UPI003F1A4051
MATPNPSELHDLLEQTDWADLDCPFRDHEDFPPLPVMVDRLLNGSASERSHVFGMLSEQINHQGGVYEITAPALLVLAVLLPDRRLDGAQILGGATPGQSGGDRPSRPLRAAVLELMWSALQEADDLTVEICLRRHHRPEWVEEPSFQQIRALRQMLLSVVLDWWQDPDPQVRQAAAALAVPVLEAPELAEHRSTLVPQVHAILAADRNPNLRYAAERCERLRYVIGPPVSGDHATILRQGFDLGAAVTAAVAADDQAEIWKVVRWFAEAWLVPLGPWDGCSETELVAAEARLGMRLPTALRQLHALLGRRDDLLGAIHPLESLDGLHLVTADGFPDQVERLVIRTENQGGRDWGIRLTDLYLDDPPVVMIGDCGSSCLASTPGDCVSHGVTMLERTSWAVLEAILDESQVHAAGVHHAQVPLGELPVVEPVFTQLGLPGQPVPPARPCVVRIDWYTGTDVLIRAERWADRAGLTLIGRTLPALEAAVAKLPDGWFPDAPWTPENHREREMKAPKVVRRGTLADLSRLDLRKVEEVQDVDIPTGTMAQIVAALDAHHLAHTAAPAEGRASDATDCGCPRGDEDVYYLDTEYGYPIVYRLGRFQPTDHQGCAPAGEPR